MTRDSHDRHVWIVNHHATLPSKDGRSGRHLLLASELERLGWSATVIVASTTHPSGAQRLGGARLRLRRTEDGVDTLWIRTNAYGSSLPRRFLGMLVFAANLLRPGATSGLREPDVVVGSTVHPFAAWAAQRLARRKKVPFVYEVRDVWPDYLIDLGKLTPRHPLSIVMRRISRRLIAAADLIVSPLPRIDAYLSESGFGDRRSLWVPNGAQTAGAPPPRRRGDEPFTFMYLGTHGDANALDGLLRAFERAWVDAPGEIRLRLVGDGPRKEHLKALATTLDSRADIRFEDRIPKSEVLARAGEADCLVINFEDHEVYRYGISPNKLFDYMLAARPVLIATGATKNPVSDAECGLVSAASDVESLSANMKRISALGEAELTEMGARGRRHVLDAYAYPHLTAKLADALDDVVDGYLPRTRRS